MNHVDQTLFGNIEGNCWPAVIGSLLHIPIEIIPNFCANDNKEWFEDTNTFLEHFGYRMVEIRLLEQTPEDVFALLGDVYLAVSGPSPRGKFDHSVVYFGNKMVHDPHPDNTGLVKITDIGFLLPIDPGSFHYQS